MIVSLHHDEIAVCQLLGRMRSLITSTAGVKDAKKGDQDGDDINVIGMIAEYAFAKHFNTFLDIGLTPRSGSADGVFMGKRYDVKATTYKHGRLLSTLKINNDVDIYVLAIVDHNQVDFVGFATATELRQDENLTDLGHGQNYSLPQDKLRAFRQ